MPWQTRNLEWTLPSLAGDLTGSLSINRTGSGLSYAGFESHAQTLQAYGAGMREYDRRFTNSALRGVGLSSLHFVSEGENSFRGAIDDSPPLTTSTTTFQYIFSAGQAAPAQSLISLFDPGFAETNGSSTSRGPVTYTFAASHEGTAVALTEWVLHVLDPYTPVGNSETTHVWDGAAGRLSVNNYTNSLDADFPDNLAFLQTGGTRFDELTITVESLASDLVGIGFIGPVPEPSTLLLVILPLACLTLRRERGNESPAC